MNLVFFSSFLLLVIAAQGYGSRYKRQDDLSTNCTSPKGKPGFCISVRNCPTLVQLLKRANKDTEAANFLRSSKCGGYAEVCCEKEDEDQAKRETDDGSRNAGSGECGRSTVNQHNRVIGGEPADLGAWPWIAALGYREIYSRNPEIMWRCGGSLINKRYILTAAHCIRTPPTIPVQLAVVRLGEHDLHNDTEGANPVDYEVEKTIVHEDYRSQTNDIALIRLNRDVTFTDKIKPICLPFTASFRTNTFERKYPFVVGWGETNLNGPSSNVLLEVQVPVVDNESCKQAYTKHGADITENQLCAGEMKGGKDSCRGDSGGPLMLPENGLYYQIGIISFGYRCAEPGYPGVYTRVSAYADWIQKNMKS